MTDDGHDEFDKKKNRTINWRWTQEKPTNRAVVVVFFFFHILNIYFSVHYIFHCFLHWICCFYNFLFFIIILFVFFFFQIALSTPYTTYVGTVCVCWVWICINAICTQSIAFNFRNILQYIPIGVLTCHWIT